MAEAPIMDINGWKAPEFRQKIVAKLDEVMRNTGPYMGKTGSDWESHLFPKAKSKEEYLSLIAKLIQHLQSFAGAVGASTGIQGAGGSGGGMPGVGQDPINALQTLTKQGPLPPGMVVTGGQPGMGGQGAMGGPGPMGPMSARVQFGQFVGHPNMQGRPMGPQGGPRNEMFLVQQSQMGGMVRPAGQSNYMMMSQFRPMMQPHQQMAGVGGMPMPYPNTLDVPSMGPVPSPAMAGSGPGSVSMVSPGMMVSGQSPGPVGILPSPVSAPSPGSALNTPGNPGSVGTHNEEQAYLEKWNQLQKYVEPLKRMINRIDKDEDRQRDLNKMKNLLDILSDSTKRLPYTTLLKCETVLEKLEFSNKAAGGVGSSSVLLAVVPPLSGPSEHMCQQLLDTVANHLKSPTLNHTLQRTFGPAVRALHGQSLRIDSPPAKRLCVDRDTDDVPSTQDDDISDIIHCEIARLHRRFIVSLDPSHHPGSKVVHLLCRLEDKKLPSVPPIMVTLPESYPDNSPSCRTLASQYESTPFLQKVNEILTTEMKHMSGCYSLTALLNMWDICVRKACAPAAIVA